MQNSLVRTSLVSRRTSCSSLPYSSHILYSVTSSPAAALISVGELGLSYSSLVMQTPIRSLCRRLLRGLIRLSAFSSITAMQAVQRLRRKQTSFLVCCVGKRSDSKRRCLYCCAQLAFAGLQQGSNYRYLGNVRAISSSFYYSFQLLQDRCPLPLLLSIIRF